MLSRDSATFAVVGLGPATGALGPAGKGSLAELKRRSSIRRLCQKVCFGVLLPPGSRLALLGPLDDVWWGTKNDARHDTPRLATGNVFAGVFLP